MLSKSTVAATLPFEGLKAAKAFYTGKIGLRLVDGSVKKGYLEFAAGKGTVIQVFESDSKKSDDTAATFEVPDLAKEMAALRKKGVKFEEYDLPGIKTVNGVATMGEHKGAWFKDPGGNVIALHEGARSSSRPRRRNLATSGRAERARA
jgi:catechol 2,3-dioxygenase-like lactoylglutathione lyase family enzyme